MTYSIEVSACGRYIHCRAHQPITATLAQDFLHDADTLGRARHVELFLLDVRCMPNVDTVLRNYKLAHEDMARLHFSRSASLAILASEGDHSHDFVETAVRNAGYDVRLFSDEATAIDWLNHRHAPHRQIG